MAFSLQPNFKGVSSYSEALARWSKNMTFSRSSKPERRTDPNLGEYDERALDGPKRHLNIRKLTRLEIERLGSDVTRTHIAFRYHRTDVVIYRDDDAVIITRYSSISTNAFAARLLPEGVHSHFTTSYYQNCSENVWSWDLVVCSDTGGNVYWHNGEPARLYRMRGDNIMLHKHVDGLYYPRQGDIKPWQIVTVDRKAARPALDATRYRDFEAWARVTAVLLHGQPGHRYDAFDRRRNERDGDLLALLQDRREGWPKLLSLTRYWPSGEAGTSAGFAAGHKRQRARRVAANPNHLPQCHADKLCGAIRRAVYLTDPEIVGVTEVDHLPSVTRAQSKLNNLALYDL